MNVCVHIFRAVILHDPVYSWEINTSRRDIRAKQHRVFSLSELEINSGTLGLLLSSMQFQNRDANLQPAESLISKSHFLASRKEHNDFVFLMSFQEAKKSVELLFNGHLHVIVKQFDWSDTLQLLSECLVFR